MTKVLVKDLTKVNFLAIFKEKSIYTNSNFRGAF